MQNDRPSEALFGMTPDEHEAKMIELLNAMREAQMRVGSDLPQGFVLAATARLLGSMCGAMFVARKVEDFSEGVTVVNEMVTDVAGIAWQALRTEAQVLKELDEPHSVH